MCKISSNEQLKMKQNYMLKITIYFIFEPVFLTSFILKSRTGGSCVRRVELDVSASGAGGSGSGRATFTANRRESERRRAQRSGRVDDCEYRFLSPVSRFYLFFLASPSFFLSLSCRCKLAWVEPGNVPASRDGRQAGGEPCWAGFAEASDRRTDRRMDVEADRRTAAVLMRIQFISDTD